MTIKAKCPKCGTDCESKQVWQMTSPRSQSVLTVYQLKCPNLKCRYSFRKYRQVG